VKHLILPLLFGVLASGCALSEADSLEANTDLANSCSGDSQCAAGASCIDGVCAASAGRIENVLLAVTPLQGAWADSTFSVGVDSLTRAGLIVGDSLSIQLEPLVQVVGTIDSVPGSPECDPEVRVTFTPLGEVFRSDLARFATAVEVRPPAPGGDVPAPDDPCIQAGSFCANLSPGWYEVDTAPLDSAENPCLPVAQGYEVGGGELLGIRGAGVGTEVDLVEGVRTLDFLVSGAGAEGWTLELLSPKSGRVVSNSVVLSSEVESDGAYRVHLEHHPSGLASSDGLTTADTYDINEGLIRARPPEGSNAANLVWVRKDVILQANGADLLVFPPAADFRQVILEAADAAGERQRARISIVSEPDDGPGTRPAYRDHILVEATDVAKVDLLPGRYRAFAVPDSLELAVVETQFQVGAADEAPSVSLEFAVRAVLSGTVQVPGGTQVELPLATEPAPTPTPPIRDFWTELLAGPLSRGSVGAVDSDGVFEIPMDAGDAVFSIRPAVSSGLPWYVNTGVNAAQSGTLGALSIPLPLVYSGSLRGPDGEVLEARVEAYVYVDVAAGSDNEKGLTAPSADKPEIYEEGGHYNDPDIRIIPVGETQSGPDGRFTLLLPPQLY
jgi:hypothetical protein